MKRTRLLGTILALGGAATLGWGPLVRQWVDPFTALYTIWRQQQLTQDYNRVYAAYKPPATSGSLASERVDIAHAAQLYRSSAPRGGAIGRIRIPVIGLNMILVNGTDHETLKKGPGRDLRSFMPSENRLVYIAGHRTTYLAPFSHIDSINAGDVITLAMPYGTFRYQATGHRVVSASDLSVLRSPAHEQLELQACHPRFFAKHRYIVYAKLVRVTPREGARYAPSALAASG